MNNKQDQKLNGVNCTVDECYYHKSGDACTATSIKVGGASCTCSDDTECATFKPN